MNKIFLCLCSLMIVFFLGCNTAQQAESEQPAAAAEKTPQAVSYTLDSAATDVQFLIVSNSAGPIVARFPEGASGSLDASGKGSLSIKLDTMHSLDQYKAENPLRDANVIEAFFGVRPSAVMKEAVDTAWTHLEGKLDRNVATARFDVSALEGMGGGAGKLTGNLVLWNKVSVPLSFPVNVTATETGLELVSTESVSFDLEQVLGADLRKLAFDTMLAAGCAHQPGIQNKVDITINKAVFKK